MLLRILLSTFLLAAPALAASPQAEGFKKLSGAQIRQAFSGKEFSDDAHFAYQYKANGVAQGTSMGKKVTNTWKVAKDQLCVTESSSEEACYFVWKKGSAVKLVIGESDDLGLDGFLK